jgi:hypothetical protein
MGRVPFRTSSALPALHSQQAITSP